MRTHISISLDSDPFPFPKVTPIGAVISYGINKIPTAMVALDPSSLNLLCDFDSYRRMPVTLNVETVNGCLHFRGVVDGLSFHQTPGGLGATLILKHPMQWLTEVYPRIIGLHPATVNIFRPNATLEVAYESPTKNEFMAQLNGYGYELDFSLNLVDFYINLMKVVVHSQEKTTRSAKGGTEEGSITVGLENILTDSDVSRTDLRNLTYDLLECINTNATQACEIKAGVFDTADQVINNVAMLQDNVFANITRLMGEIGCCVVVGNSQAYIIPEASYLSVPKLNSLQRGKTATNPNIIFPAEYDNFVFNDNGFVNIKGIYVIADNGVTIAQAGIQANVDKGVYIDPNPYARGNILVTTLPTLIGYGIVEAAVRGSTGLQPKIRSGVRLLTDQLTAIDTDNSTDAAFNATIASIEARKVYMDNWAEMEYCKLKYDDRTGSISSYFRNNWAPGTVGTLYTRQPGTYIDFFVTDVTHSFSVSTPNQGSATTNISFKSGRLGSVTNEGVDELSLYHYGYAHAQAFAKEFITDIS